MLKLLGALTKQPRFTLLLTMQAAQALAQAEAPSAPAFAAEHADAVLVTGARASLRTAQGIKRERTEIVDAIVADDINKLPDFSVTDALQRVTGVQIARDRGEGGTVAIRGLTQMETTLNGREIFTAGMGRNLDFSDLAAETIASINVYKTSSAEHIEGGVGGLIDLRTRRPFDFKEAQAIGSARTIHGDLVGGSKSQYSMLLSKRWATGNGGEFGALLSVAHQERGWREDQKSTGNPVARTDLIPGRTVIAPNGTSETTSLGNRQRSGANIALQWRPTDSLDLYAEGSFAQFKTLQNSQQINIASSSTFVAGSPALFPGSNDLQSITWTNAPLSILSFARDTVDRTTQGAIGGSWTHQDLRLKADLSHTKSFNSLFFSGPVFSGTAASFTQDLSTRVPGNSVGGTNLLDPANFNISSIAYRYRPFEGALSTARLDGEQLIDRGPFTRLAGGLRLARRDAGNGSNLIFGDTSVSIPAASRPGDVQANPYNDFFPGSGSSSLQNFIVGKLDGARDAAALRATYGIVAPLPSAGSPLGIWAIKEETRAAYLLADFEASAQPLDGNIGLRIVQTREKVAGSQSLAGSAAIAPIAIDSTYIDYLPSANLRYEVSDGLFLRGAASKTITRPDFNQLSPSLTLIPNNITPALNQGSAGNPELHPVRANNLDVAIERYFSKSTALHLTAFIKKVDGFVTTVSSPEVHDGQLYQVSRPQNTAAANIKGAELGYQQFYDFLPGWLGGLGLQANYTYIASHTPSSILGQDVPLQNLSKHSYNLIGMYEKGQYSARLAYNWRDKFLSGIASFVGVGAMPVYTRAYGWLDASLTYRASDKISIAVEGLNLLRTQRSSYYGVDTRPQSNWLNDTQIGATITLRF